MWEMFDDVETLEQISLQPRSVINKECKYFFPWIKYRLMLLNILMFYRLLVHFQKWVMYMLRTQNIAVCYFEDMYNNFSETATRVDVLRTGSKLE